MCGIGVCVAEFGLVIGVCGGGVGDWLETLRRGGSTFGNIWWFYRWSVCVFVDVAILIDGVELMTILIGEYREWGFGDAGGRHGSSNGRGMYQVVSQVE